jgi:hypothetical protein
VDRPQKGIDLVFIVLADFLLNSSAQIEQRARRLFPESADLLSKGIKEGEVLLPEVLNFFPKDDFAE